MKLTEKMKKNLAILGGVLIGIGLIAAIGMQFGPKPSGEDVLPGTGEMCIRDSRYLAGNARAVNGSGRAGGRWKTAFVFGVSWGLKECRAVFGSAKPDINGTVSSR